ncbi:glycosyltransferase [Salidesulfovibrio onnuriiensis]|uniref:glycosyltransferase n=1 Tax=Salidesulfovibrio onnuriiensis TaxID=2583823 RepID=UPI0011C8209D|nr:glycosyltransferase [Salidesulfovibrio onnuriiensis]
MSGKAEKPSAILRISAAGSVQETLRKFGSLDNLLTHDGKSSEGIFDRNIMVWCFCRSGSLKLDLGEWTIIDRAIRYFLFSGVMLLLKDILLEARKCEIRLIRAYDPYWAGILGFLFARLFRCPWVISVHADFQKREALQPGSIPRVFGSRLPADAVERFLVRRVHRLLPIRASLVPHFVSAGCPEENIRVIPHGMDMDVLTALPATDVRSEFGLPGDCRLVSSIGRLELENYSEDIVKIALGISARRRDVHVLICGEGRQLEAMKQRVAESGYGDRIVFTGYIAHDLALDVRKRSDANLALMGGFSLIEACASGRPVVAYDVEWHSELVRTGETGLLAREGDVEAVVGVLEQWLEDDAEASRLGTAARALALEKHELRKVERIRAAVYSELLAE